jgi:hypothetical protein
MKININAKESLSLLHRNNNEGYGTVASDELIMHRIAYYIIPVLRKLKIN